MKKLFIPLFGTLIAIPMFASISNIEKDGVWYRLYDENGKQYKSVSSSVMGGLKGYSASLVIFQDGAFFHVYDCDLKKLKSCAISTYGEVLSVSGDTFTTKLGNWIYTYDQNGKKINSRVSN
ncbi:MAG: hypothetical protein NC391_04650 [Alistipes timonensis]|nr:hypothetical protein [Alistipes timonensis]